jgi:hypothetical protein
MGEQEFGIPQIIKMGKAFTNSRKNPESDFILNLLAPEPLTNLLIAFLGQALSSRKNKCP